MFYDYDDYEIWTHEDKFVDIPEGLRVRWVYDEEYRSEDSYGADTEEETAEMVRLEKEGFERGKLVALGCIIEDTETGEEFDSLWGIVVPPHDRDAMLGTYESMSAPDAIAVAERRFVNAKQAFERAQQAFERAQQMLLSARVKASVASDVPGIEPVSISTMLMDTIKDSFTKNNK